MRDNVRFLLSVAAAWGFVVLSLAATALLVDLDLSEQEHAQAIEILGGHAAHVVTAALLLLVPLVFLVRSLFRRHVRAPRQLAEDARVMLTARSDEVCASLRRPWYARVRASWCSNHP